MLICEVPPRRSARALTISVYERPGMSAVLGSACVAIQPATSSVARASPADALGPYAASAATTRPSVTTGAITEEDWQEMAALDLALR